MVLRGIEPDAARARLSGSNGGFPAFDAILARLARREETFVAEPAAAGVDWSVENEVRGVRNRARVKCWSPEAGKLLVWFYKRSAVAWSRDRFSYGGVLVGTEPVPDDQVESWVRFQLGGFHPEERPKGIRRSFPFDLPG